MFHSLFKLTIADYLPLLSLYPHSLLKGSIFNNILIVPGIPNTAKDIEERQIKFGRNVLPTHPPPSFLLLVWQAMQDTTLIILEVAAAISLALSFYHDPKGGEKISRCSGREFPKEVVRSKFV